MKLTKAQVQSVVNEVRGSMIPLHLRPFVKFGVGHGADPGTVNLDEKTGLVVALDDRVYSLSDLRYICMALEEMARIFRERWCASESTEKD